jgi:glycosyltransferase involved in cell wall biosynthesis
MDLARVQLAELAGVASLAVADSDYNRAELDALGYSPTATCHLLVDLSAYHATPDPRVLARRRRLRAGGGADWLFVGRLAPNKCQHDVIAAFALYRAVVDPEARLTLVGGGTAPRYVTALRALVADLGVADAVDLPDSLDFPALLAVWATTDVLVCLSEHEGFCVPILEAMELGVPVVAYAAAAVPETLGDAGVLLTDKDPAVVALEVEALLGDGERRAAAVAAGRARAGLFSLERTSAAMLAALVGAAR